MAALVQGTSPFWSVAGSPSSSPYVERRGVGLARTLPFALRVAPAGPAWVTRDRRGHCEDTCAYSPGLISKWRARQNLARPEAGRRTRFRAGVGCPPVPPPRGLGGSSRGDRDSQLGAHTCAAGCGPSTGQGRGGNSRRASSTGRARLAAIATRSRGHTHVPPDAVGVGEVPRAARPWREEVATRRGGALLPPITRPGPLSGSGLPTVSPSRGFYGGGLPCAARPRNLI